MSSISAGTTTGTALVSTGDTTGSLVLKTNNGTTAVTIGTDQVVTLAQPLPAASGGTGGTSLSGLTVGTATNLAGGGAGQIPYNTGSGATSFLAAGTSGQVLQSNGASAPSWVTAGGGSWIYLSTVTASGSSTVNVETTFNSTYDAYAIIGTNIYNDTNGGFYVRLKIGGSYITTTTYSYIVDESNSSTSTPSYTAVNSNTLLKIGSISGVGSTLPTHFVFHVAMPASSIYPIAFWDGAAYNAAGYPQRMSGTGLCVTQGLLTGVRFYPQGGTISGNFRLYGIKNS